MIKNTINKRTLQALNNRMFQKDVALLFGVSPSTIRRWRQSVKPIKTIKNYDSKLNQVRKTVLKSKNKKTYQEKKENKYKYVEGIELEPKNYYGEKNPPKNKPPEIIHYSHEFSDFYPELIVRKMYDIIDNNTIQEIELTNCFIKLYVTITEWLKEESKNISYKDYVSTPTFIIAQYDGKAAEIYEENISELIHRAQDLKNNQYGGGSGNIVKVNKVILVEKHLTEKGDN